MCIRDRSVRVIVSPRYTFELTCSDQFSGKNACPSFLSLIHILVARGEVEGHLVLEEKGNHGFGYDPLFVPLGYENTFGELDSELKNRISHRARALQKLREELQNREENR